MKKVLYTTIVLILVTAMIFGGIYLNQKSIDNAYNYSITLIQNGSYEGALTELEKANPNLLDRKEFKDDLKYQKLNDAYKNTVPLYAYALAQFEYNDENKSMYSVNDYLELIPADYSGELCEEIKTFKGNFKPQYDEFLAEQKRQAEIKMKIDREKEAERLRNSVPYVGMSESQINSTSLGKYANVWHNTEIIKGSTRATANIYEFKKGNATIFQARCLQGKVIKVWDYRDDPRVVDRSTPKKKVKKEDPYNVNDYSSEEDFYDDHYDDFWDYEDAEDYYREHHD